MSVFHTCPACHRTFTRAEWSALEFVGIQIVEADDGGPVEAFEMRNCPCTPELVGTMSVLVGRVQYEADGRPIWYETLQGCQVPTFPPLDRSHPFIVVFDALRATAARCMELREENRRLLALEMEVGRVLADVASPIDFPDRIPPGSDPADISADSYQEHIDRATCEVKTRLSNEAGRPWKVAFGNVRDTSGVGASEEENAVIERCCTCKHWEPEQLPGYEYPESWKAQGPPEIGECALFRDDGGDVYDDPEESSHGRLRDRRRLAVVRGGSKEGYSSNFRTNARFGCVCWSGYGSESSERIADQSETPEEIRIFLCSKNGSDDASGPFGTREEPLRTLKEARRRAGYPTSGPSGRRRYVVEVLSDMTRDDEEELRLMLREVGRTVFDPLAELAWKRRGENGDE